MSLPVLSDASKGCYATLEFALFSAAYMSFPVKGKSLPESECCTEQAPPITLKHAGPKDERERPLLDRNGTTHCGLFLF